MEAKSHIELMSIAPYRHLFPAASVIDHTVKKGASVSDTVTFIPQVVQKTTWQVQKFVAQELKGLPLYEACNKLWQFVKYHIKYEKDERGSEQVRSPRRLIHDLKGDCDCFTTFVDTCLHALGVTGIINRITKYKAAHFQHIYPVVPDGKGGYIIMDCVVDTFNYEEPYSEKKDFKMDLQFLDGIDDQDDSGQSIQKNYGYSDLMGDLGKILKRRNEEKARGAITNRQPILKRPNTQQNRTAAQVPVKTKSPQAAKALKTVNKVNKVNPATVLLRAGILASMKLNVLKVAERLKWGYASRELAQAKGMDMSKYDRLKELLAKTEKIFYAAGGQPENLRKAIVTGNGNRNHEVAGVNDDTELSAMLEGIYNDEFVNGMEGFEGFGELGEPTTAASLAAASTTMGTLAALLKAIGELFPKKPATKPTPSKKSNGSGQSSSSGEEVEEEGATDVEESSSTDQSQEISEEETSSSSEGSEEPIEETPAEEVSEEPTDGILSGTTKSLKAFWTKNKKWLLPVGLSALAIGGMLIYAATEGSTDKKPKPKQNSLNGWTKPRKSSRKGGKSKSSPGKKQMIALM